MSGLFIRLFIFPVGTAEFIPFRHDKQTIRIIQGIIVVGYLLDPVTKNAPAASIATGS